MSTNRAGWVRGVVRWIAAMGVSAALPGPHGLGAQEAGGPHLSLPQVIEVGPEGPALLLIPCAGCGASSWSAFMEANRERFRMIAVTLPGYAGSLRPELPLWGAHTPFQDNAIRQISALLDERGLEDVVVVGQSFGSLVGLRLAAERPDVVTGLVNIDGSPTNPAGRAAHTPTERLAEARSVVDDDWAVRLQDPETFRSFNAATTQPTQDERKRHHGMFMASDRVSMVHYWRENLLRDRNPDFVSLEARYLDVRAVRPRFADPDSVVRAHDATLDSIGRPKGYERVVFFDTSHWVHLEHPSVLGAIVHGWLEGRPQPDVGPFRFGEVLRAGDGDRHVILMPCLGCDASAWSDFMERNRARYRMWALTWPGMGDSALPRVVEDVDGTPYFDHLVRALELLIRRENMERPVIVGHSAAAVLAVRFAKEHPELLSGVVNVDAIVANGETHGFSADERRAWADEEMRGVLDRYDDDEAWAALNAAPSSMHPERGAFYARMWARPPRDHVFAYWREWLRTDVGVLLPDLEVPFLAIHALRADPERAAETVEDLRWRYGLAPLPAGARVTFIEDSGHTIWEYRPDAFDRALADFVLGSAESTVGGVQPPG